MSFGGIWHPIDVSVAVEWSFGSKQPGLSWPKLMTAFNATTFPSLYLPFIAKDFLKLIVYPQKCLVSIECWQSRDCLSLEADHSSQEAVRRTITGKECVRGSCPYHVEGICELCLKSMKAR
jgi:hypothetical protein